MSDEETIELAKKCGVTHNTWDAQDKRAILAFATEIRNRTLDEANRVLMKSEIKPDVHVKYPWLIEIVISYADAILALKNPLHALNEYGNKLREDMTGITSYIKGDEK